MPKLTKSKKTPRNPAESAVPKPKGMGELLKEYDLGKEANSLAILRKMMEHLEFYSKIIQQILQPEEFYSLHECMAFNDDDKRRLFDLYKKIIMLHRRMLKMEILNDDSVEKSLLGFHKEALSIKPEIIEIIDKMQSSWTATSPKRDTVKYFG